MNTQSTPVVGVFDTWLEANRAVDQLQEAGFDQSQIGVVARQAEGSADGASNDDKMSTGSGVLAGALGGTGLGALAGVGVLTGVVPVVGPAIAAGTLGVILCNAIAGAGICGLIGTLAAAGVSEPVARYYQGQFEAGRIVVTVDAGNRTDEATEIVLDCGGHFMSSRQAASVPA